MVIAAARWPCDDDARFMSLDGASSRRALWGPGPARAAHRGIGRSGARRAGARRAGARDAAAAGSELAKAGTDLAELRSHVRFFSGSFAVPSTASKARFAGAVLPVDAKLDGGVPGTAVGSSSVRLSGVATGSTRSTSGAGEVASRALSIWRQRATLRRCWS